MQGNIRIIGGRFKGKKIPVLTEATLRPTPNRVRETLFNWLMHDLPEAMCLDAFSGSGALGLEALSRGAKKVVLLEKSREIYAALKKTVASFDSQGIEIYHEDAFDYLKQTSLTFDIIFLDPPFQSDLLQKCLDLLKKTSVLTPNGRVYVESEEPITPAPEGWECLRHQKAGAVYYGLYSYG